VKYKIGVQGGSKKHILEATGQFSYEEIANDVKVWWEGKYKQNLPITRIIVAITPEKVDNKHLKD
jgi:hypothetical protein